MAEYQPSHIFIHIYSQQGTHMYQTTIYSHRPIHTYLSLRTYNLHPAQQDESVPPIIGFVVNHVMNRITPPPCSVTRRL